MGKLDETRDWCELYLHQIGTSEVPRNFHFWASMSLLAAAVGDRVWIEPDAGRKIFPNLYVFLIGPSGSGKEQAVMGAAKLGTHEPILDLFMGRATRQYLLDYLTKDGPMEDGMRYAHNPHLYLVTEELGSAIRAGDLGHDLISFMTEFYTGKPVGQDGTRGSGMVTLYNPCFNWLAGTTDEWLIRAVDRDAIEGGFFARVIAVRGRRNYKERCPQIVYPPDRDEVREHLKWRVSQYALLRGGFRFTPAAQALHDEWYMQRAEPADSLEEPGFNRSDEMVFRLSLLLRLSEIDLVVDDHGQGAMISPHVDVCHFTEALHLWEGLAADMPATMRKASATERSNVVDVVGEILQRSKAIDHSTLLKRVGNRGMDHAMLQSAIATLKERGEITEELVKTAGRPRKVYRWS